MEFLILGLIILAFPVIAIVALVKAVGLGERMRTLESRFEALEGRIATGPVAAAALPGAPPQPAAPVTPPPPPELSEPVLRAPPPSAPPPFDLEQVVREAQMAAAAKKEAEAAEVAADTTPPAAPATPQPPTAPEIPPEVTSLEERFGTRWVVWIGGVALALGGIFLVKYSIEAGLIGPRLRLFFGALLAAALIATGERMRRKELITGFAGVPSAHIPSILTAAGTVVAYAVVYAAYALYGFLSAGPAFVLLGLVALATLAAALLHGPGLAALGLVGAYVTPLLVATTTPNYWALYIYLVVVTCAALALARIRMWRWLALTAIAFSFLWTFPGLGDTRVDTLAPHALYIVVCFALVAAMIVAGLLYGPPAEPGKIDPVSSVAIGAFLVSALVLTVASRHAPLALVVFTVLTVAALAIAWRTDAAAAVVPLAAALAAWFIIRWALYVEIAQLTAAPGTAGAQGATLPPVWQTDVGPHLMLGAGFAILFGVAGFMAQGRSASALIPLLWSAAGVLAPIAILIALYYRVSGFERSIPFAGIALLLAAAFATATEALDKRDPRPGLASATALYATGAVAALALALTFAMEKGWLTVSLALMVAGIAWVAEQRPLPMLRWLAAALVALVLARTAWEPRIVGSALGSTPIFNWLLWGYGVPALAFWVGGTLLRRRDDDVPARMVDSAAILFTVLLGFLQVRHFMTGGDIYRDTSNLGELALHVCVGFAMAIGLEHVRRRTQSIVHDVGAILIAIATFLAAVFGLLIAENPIVTGAPVGGPVINLILLGYGVPAVLAIILAMQTRGLRPPPYRVCAATIAVVLMLAYVTLQTTRFFHSSVLTDTSPSDLEKYTYSVVWLAYGVALLLFGIYFRSQPARLASALVTALTIAKVFFIDMGDLTGIWRALSFIALGLVLVGIGYLYQRLLFPKNATAAAGAPGAPPST
jgi:uncharacterized membrane protein